MNILVTGGAGFIGSNFIRLLVERYPYKVINLDLLTYAGNLSTLNDISHNKNYHFIKGDICNRELVNDIIRSFEVDVIVNFAAESHVDRSIMGSEVFVKTNIMGTQVLLECAKEYWSTSLGESQPRFRDGAKYIQISTDEVYGTLGSLGYFTEATPLAPNSPYSASKASADLMVRAFFETYGLPMNITRCSNNYGPFQHPEKLIPLMIHRAIGNKPLPVYGDGRQVRDWLHVKDHCSAIDAVMHRGKTGEVYNIGGNNEKENIEVVKLILQKLGKSEELISHVQDRLGHDRRYAIDNRKIINNLGWEPSYSFERGIDETVEWYLENQRWVTEVLEKND